MLQNTTLHFHHRHPRKLLLPRAQISSPQLSTTNNAAKSVKFSRRELVLFAANSSMFLQLGPRAFGEPSKAIAEETPDQFVGEPQSQLEPSEAIVDQTPDKVGEPEPEPEPAPEPSEAIITDETRDQVGQPEPSKAIVEEIQDQKVQTEPESPSPARSCNDKRPTKKAFLDVSVDGEPVGRIVIGLYGKDSPTGAARFGKLVSGAAGISYRRKEFVKIMPNYVQHSGVRSYGVDAELASRTGSNLTNQSLIDEWERENQECPGTKNLAGTVGIIVRNPSKPPPNLKLVARKGKLEIDQEEVVKDPNGTEFVISIKDSPELDNSTLVIGKVLEGMEVVKRIAEVKTVNENTSSPYFRVAKLIGDKRAVVAERGFNRPYSKVLVTNCGLVE